MSFFAPLKHRPIFLLWIGQTLSAIGDQCFTMAVLWIAAQRAGADVGLIGAAQYGAALFSGTFAGVYADRWNRRRTMITVDIIRAALVMMLPLLAFADALPLWPLVVVGAALQGLGPFFDASLSASLPALVPQPSLLTATNGMMNTTRRIARLAGPLLVAWLASVMPIENLFTLDAVSYAISALTVLAIGAGFAWQASGVTSSPSGIRGIVAEQSAGLRALRARPVLWWAIVGSALPSLLWGMVYIAGIPLLAQSAFGNDISAYSYLVSAYGLGNIVSNVLLSTREIRRRTVVLWAGHLVLSLGFVWIGASPILWVALIGAFFAATGGPMGDLMLTVLIQENMPSAHAGKAFAFLYTMWTASMVAGLLLATPLFTAFPVRPVFVVASVIGVVFSIAGMLIFGREKAAPVRAEATRPPA